MSLDNQVRLMGFLGQKPEIIRIGTKQPFAKVQVATNKVWKKDGVKHTRTDWHTVVINRPFQVAYTESYLDKGDRVMLQGELRTRKWKTKEGKTCYTTEVIAESLKQLSYKNNEVPLDTAEDDIDIDAEIPADDF